MEWELNMKDLLRDFLIACGILLIVFALSAVIYTDIQFENSPETKIEFDFTETSATLLYTAKRRNNFKLSYEPIGSCTLIPYDEKTQDCINQILISYCVDSNKWEKCDAVQRYLFDGWERVGRPLIAVPVDD